MEPDKTDRMKAKRRQRYDCSFIDKSDVTMTQSKRVCRNFMI